MTELITRNRVLPQFIRKIFNQSQSLNISIRAKILISFILVISMLSCVNVILMLNSLKYSERYNIIVTNITDANSINGTVKASIDSEMWDIVAGKIEFENGIQYEILEQANENIRELMKNVSSKDSRTRLDVTLRTLKTLRHYVDIIGQQIKEKKKVTENEKVLEEIRAVSSLVDKEIQVSYYMKLKVAKW